MAGMTMKIPDKIYRKPPKISRYRLSSSDISPDNLYIVVDWDKMTPGTSAFIPCINVIELTRQINDHAQKQGWNMEYHARIESGLWGVRFWRLA